MKKCPYKTGDIVVYAPTPRGRDLLVMTDLARLRPGEKYIIVEIYEEDFLVLKGFEKALPSAVFWTEFRSAEPNQKDTPDQEPVR